MEYPTRADTSKPEVSNDEKRLIQFGEKLWAEGRATQELLGIPRRVERAAKFVAGEGQWPQDVRETKKYFAAIVLNITRSIIERKAGMLTDSRPQLDIRSRTGNEAAAKTLTQVIEGIWTERSIQQVLTDGIIMAQKAGWAPAYIPWDKSLDYGRGDVGFDFLQTDQCVFDSAVRRASDFQRGEYAVFRSVLPISEFLERYPKRGHLVQPSKTLSQYSQTAAEGVQGQIKSPIRSWYSIWRRPSRQDSEAVDSAIPRAYEYQLYFRDRTLNPEKKFNEDDSPNYLFPRKRVICWSGDVILFDGHSKYWDGLFPGEILDWGIETDNPFGESEVDVYRSMQEAINMLVSGAVNNARLINNPPKHARLGALEPSEIEELERYGDQPGRVWETDQVGDIVNMPPGAYAQVVLAVVQSLQQGMELISGMSEVTSGKRPSGVTSGVALDTLILSAQTIIRLQGRAVEDFLARAGQLLISRVIQYYTGRRILNYHGATGEAQQAVWEREQFVRSLMQAQSDDEIDRKLQDLFRDFSFKVIPGSSLAATKLQKAQIIRVLAAEGRLSDLEVLKASEIPDPEKKLEEARQEQLQKAQVAMSLGGRGQLPRQGKKPSDVPQAERQVPTPQRGGVGTEQRNLQSVG